MQPKVHASAARRDPDRMKICFLSNPRYLHTQRWARFFSERGHDVHIIGDPVVDGPRSVQMTTHSPSRPDRIRILVIDKPRRPRIIGPLS